MHESIQDVRRLAEVDSTNTLARAEANARAAAGETLRPVLYLADEQRAGRGRLGRTWYSPPGRGNVYASLLVPAAHLPIEVVPRTSLAAGIAIAEALAALTGLHAALKWPNDLVVGRRKIAGILCEGVLHRDELLGVVIGLGLNVGGAPADFPAELSDSVTSIESEGARVPDRDGLVREWLDRLLPMLGALESPHEWLPRWRERAALPRAVKLADGRLGEARDIDASGRLVVATDRGDVAVGSGTVTWT